MKSLGWVVKGVGRLKPIAARRGRWDRYMGRDVMHSWVQNRIPGSAILDRLITSHSQPPELKCRSQGMIDPLLISNLYFLKQLALCFSQWMELSNQPQVN